MKALAFLQNTWVKNPEGLRAIYARHDEAFRRDMIYRLLFRGCKTGRMLRCAFGDICEEVIWDEVSREITGDPHAKVKADHIHICATLNAIQPDVVLSFGAIARPAIERSAWAYCAIYGPHPAARHATVADELKEMAKQLLLLKSQDAILPTPKP